MGENRDYMVHQEELGAIQISEEVVAAIVTHAAAEVDGMTGLMTANVGDVLTGNNKKFTSRGVRVETTEEGLVITLYIVVRYGCSIEEVATKVQEAAYSALESMTGFEVKTTVNVHVGGISFNNN